MNNQRMMDLSVLEEILAAQERSLSWLSSYKGEGTLGENGPYMQMRQAIDKLRAIINGPGVDQEQDCIGWLVVQRIPEVTRHFSEFGPSSVSEEDKAEFDVSFTPLYDRPAPVQEWPILDKPAKVGGGRFHVGVSTRLVVEAAQRHYEYEVTPEKEAERIARASKAIDALVAPVQAVPDGWQLVPKEPTDEMLSAISWECDPSGYIDMLAAAPQPPEGSTAQSVACPTDKEK